MTQIAAATASIGGKAAHAGKGHGAHAAKGTDFAALAMGLGLPTGEGETSDADALALTGDGSGAGAEAGTDGEKAADPVVVDLALAAAAQSAVADVVAAQPQPAALPAATDLSTTAAKPDDAIALDGRAAGRPSWRLAQVMSGTEATTVATPGVAAAAAPTAIPTDLKALVTRDGTSSAALQDAPVMQATADTQAAPPRTLRTGVQTGAAFRQAARDAVQPANDSAPTDAVVQTQAAPINPLIQQAVRDPKLAPAVTTATAQPTEGETADPALLAALQTAVTDAGQAPAAPLAYPTAAANTGLRPTAPFRPVAPAQSAATSAVVQDAATDAGSVVTASTGAPVMSVLHRASAATGEAHKGQQAGTATTATADIARNGAGQAQDQGQEGRQDARQDSTAATRTSDSQATSVVDDTRSSGTQYSDILQSLPPIAQSRMGGVSEASAVVTGPGDVGATLQGQAIDMGVDGQWIDRMAQEITTLAAGNGHSRFQLNPPNLGRIQIDVWQGESGGQVQVLTETHEAAKRLMDGKADLQSDARLASLSLNSITIERASAGFDGGQDQSAQQNPQQTPQRHQQGQEQASQGNNQMGTQTGTQSDGRNGGQASQNLGAQANAQGNGQGQQNNSGQGKSSLNRDVLRDGAGTAAQDGSVRRDGDRLVRYA